MFKSFNVQVKPPPAPPVAGQTVPISSNTEMKTNLTVAGNVVVTNVNTTGVVQAAAISTTGTLTSNIVKVTDDMFIADKLALGMVAGEDGMTEPPERLYIANGNVLLTRGNIELTVGNINLKSGKLIGASYKDLLHTPADTSGIPENAANLYYTDARVRTALSAGQGLAYNSSTGLFTANIASTSTQGVVTLADSTSNTSTTHAATANAIFTVNSNANTRVSKQGDTMTGQLVCNSSDAIISARNTSNAAGQHASIVVQSGGSLAGNASVVLDVAGVVGWSLGVDNSDADRFKLLGSNNFASGSNNFLSVDRQGNVGIGIAQTSNKLHVSGGTFKASLPAPVQSTWRDLSFEGTSLWGDACAAASEYGGTLYGTLRQVMLQNPHIVPAAVGGNASVRIGRSGGISTGVFWEAATRTDKKFCITKDGAGATGMAIDETGNMVVSGDVTAFGSLSDARLKEGIVPFDGAAALETVCELNPVHFRWRQDISNVTKRGTADDGLIAQEVAKVYPVASQAIQALDGNTFNTVRYEKLTPLLIKSVQQLCVRIGELEHRVSCAEAAAAAAAAYKMPH